MVLHLNLDPEALHDEDHLRAQVLEVVHGRDGEVPLLVAGLEAEVRLLVAPGVPNALDRVDLVEGRALVLGEANVVEDEELGLGAEVDGVGDTGRLQVPLRLQRMSTISTPSSFISETTSAAVRSCTFPPWSAPRARRLNKLIGESLVPPRFGIIAH